ncbi:OmpA family protein [Nocardiopsis changdeensis]|uniref:OmpA family protein n=1 Tax=Nocardiopsis changdeensis TaxID=2831969 RepID=A0ABX8BNQ9_9ACTN|nr:MULTISPECIES: OmpA family protein [Nocardiopsis]QUX22506.1 OmpA family protein [Nocardiopsis changdeensis]QYX38448.1 OmpA family protein [Nocardiopsis sp. MT53]
MSRSPWSIAAEALATVLMLVGPPLLASVLGWPPQRTEMSWTWLMQYLRGGTLPSAAVITAAVVALWAVWAAHLVIVVLDVVAVLRGLVPRVGLIRLVWVLSAGGATAATTTTASWADTTTFVAGEEEAGPQEAMSGRGGEQAGDERIHRVRTLSHFGFDSAELTPQMRESLAATVEMISELGDPDAPVVVTGHTDPTGDPVYNQDLSERRAQVVVDHLKERTGRDDVRFEVQGAGEDRPPEEAGVSYERYRRVEIAYTLRPAPDPVSAPSADTQEQRSSPEDRGETVQVEVVASEETAAAAHPVLIGAAAGAAGLGVGYAAGRHKGALRHRHSPSGTDEREGSIPSAGDAPPPEPDDDLVRRDPEGVARGVVDVDGFVLVAEETRVRGNEGVGLTGLHAEAALRAMVTDHLPGPVIATESALTALGGPDAVPTGVQKVESAHEALIEVDILMLHTAREGLSGERSTEAVEGRQAPLVVCTDQDFTARESPRPAGSSGGVVCVLGGTGAGVVLEFQSPDRVSMTAPIHREISDRPRLSARGTSSGEEPAETDLPKGDTAEAVNGPAPAHPGGEAEQTSPERVQVRLLSPHLVCEVDGQAVQGFRSSSLALLAVLALKGGVKGISDQELLGCLAPDTDVERARRLRSNAVTSLRNTVRKALDLSSEAPVIEKEGGFYRLQDGLFDVDVHRFWKLRKEASKEEDGASTRALKEAIGLYKSDLLSDSDEEWLGRYRRRLQMEFSDTCTRLIKGTKDAEEKVSLIDLALHVDPMNEVLHREKMIQYSQMGRKEMVHRSFREMKEILSHFGARPDAISQDLFRDLTG